MSNKDLANDKNGAPVKKKLDVLSSFRLPHWEDLPDEPVYTNRILVIIDEYFHDLFEVTKTPMLTRSMINNYVKGHIIAPPVNRKYEKITVAELVLISLLKTTYTMDEVTMLLNLGRKFEKKPKSIYNRVCRSIEEAIKMVYSKNIEVDTSGSHVDRHFKYILTSFALSFACKLYVQTEYLYDAKYNKYK